MSNSTRQFLTITILLALTISAFAADTIRSTDIGRSVTIIGKLGQPLGRVIQIEGTPVESTDPLRRQKALMSALLLRVNKVQGVALPEPVVIELSFPYDWSEHKLAPGERRVFTGYEGGRFDGIPNEATPHIKNLPASKGWGFSTYFIILK